MPSASSPPSTFCPPSQPMGGPPHTKPSARAFLQASPQGTGVFLHTRLNTLCTPRAATSNIQYVLNNGLFLEHCYEMKGSMSDTYE